MYQFQNCISSHFFPAVSYLLYILFHPVRITFIITSKPPRWSSLWLLRANKLSRLKFLESLTTPTRKELSISAKVFPRNMKWLHSAESLGKSLGLPSLSHLLSSVNVSPIMERPQFVSENSRSSCACLTLILKSCQFYSTAASRWLFNWCRTK